MKVYKLKDVPKCLVGLHHCTMTDFDFDNIKNNHFLIPADMVFSNIALYDNPESGVNVWYLRNTIPDVFVEREYELP